MDAESLLIADAVAAAINAADLSQEVTAERLYVPVRNLENMETAHCSVVPGATITSEQADRGRSVFTYTTEVCIQKKTEPTRDNLDALVKFVENEIAGLFRSKKLTEYEAARCFAVVIDPTFDPDQIEEFSQFTSVVILTFRVWR